MKTFSELTGKEKGIELLRWISVLPVAVLAGLVGDTIMYFVVVRFVMSDLSREGFDRWLRYLIGGFLGGAIFVIAGAKTAPRFRIATAIVLAVGSIALAVRIHWFPHRDEVPIVSKAVAVACGAAFIVYSEKPKGPRTQRDDHSQTDKPAVAGVCRINGPAAGTCEDRG